MAVVVQEEVRAAQEDAEEAACEEAEQAAQAEEAEAAVLVRDHGSRELNRESGAVLDGPVVAFRVHERGWPDAEVPRTVDHPPGLAPRLQQRAS